MEAALKAKRDDLDERIEALEAQAKPVRQQLGNMDSTLSKLRNERSQVNAKIAAMNEKPRVSDHAVIRYLERKYGFGFEDVRGEILTPAVVEAMRAGVESVKTHAGTLKLKGKTVVTFID
jgi:predicted site-specific integrase-resolvase